MSLAPVAEALRGVSRPRGPYVGLVPYDEGDAAFFFGRSTEVAIVAANLRAARLTILYGPSGVGKSSLLLAGAVHDLREVARTGTDESPFAVCVFRSWRDDPAHDLREAARVALQELAGAEPLPPPAATLTETLRAWTGRTGTLLVVFDQFEEYFQYHPDEGGDERLTGFAAELARIVNDPSLPVNVLLSIREDAWAKLDRFEGHVPSLFSNYVRVDHLDLEAAREAIEGPIEAWNRSLPEGEQPFEIEPALVEAVLAATAGGGLTLTAGSEGPTAEAPGDRVEAPFLQLVLERLWRDSAAAGKHTLTLAQLEALGGAGRIVENHLLDALGRLTPAEQDTASDCFRFLVSRSKTKIAHPAADLAEWTQRPEAQITGVLDKLCTGESGRILRAVAPAQDDGQSTSYELFHDILAEPILDWRRGYEQERDRRRALKRFVRIGGGLLALVAVFAALGIWALVQRSDARRATVSAERATVSARRATTQASSLALASTATDLLGARPDVSLLLSLEAYRTSPSVQAKSSMISALEAALSSGAAAILHGHTDEVWSVAFSPDGRTLATASWDQTVRLWDVRTHKQLGQPLVGHTDSVYGVTFSPDGRTLASAGDETVRFWDVRTHRQLGQPLRGHTNWVFSVSFSPDGRMLATASQDKTVRLWDVGTHRQLGQPLVGHTSRVWGVAFSPDGRTLASAGDDETVRLWDVRTQRQLGQPLRHTDPLLGVAFSPDGRTLASASWRTVRLWDVRTQRQLGQPLRGHADWVDRVAFSPDGRTLASAGDDKTVRLWDVRTQRPLGEPLVGHTDAVNGVAFSPDGRTLASSGDDKTMRLWNVRTHPQLGQPLVGHTDGLDAVAFSPDGRTLASAGETVLLWDVRTQRQLDQPLRGHTDPVLSVAFSPDGRTLASASYKTVLLWDARTYRQLGQPLGGHADWVLRVAFSPDGRTLASAGDDGTVRLWDVRTQRQLGQPLVGHADAVWSVAFSPDGRTLASAGVDETVRLWDVRSHGQLGQPLRHTDALLGVAFSPDGHTLASASWRTVRLWDVRTHRQLGQPLRGHTDWVDGVAFSPDGRTLASAGAEQTVRLWDVPTHRQLGQPLVGHTDAVDDVAFSPDGRTLASAGDDKTVRLWEGLFWRDFEELETQVCGLVANLTRAEWAEFVPGLAYRTTCPD